MNNWQKVGGNLFCISFTKHSGLLNRGESSRLCGAAVKSLGKGADECCQILFYLVRLMGDVRKLIWLTWSIVGLRDEQFKVRWFLGLRILGRTIWGLKSV